MFLFMAYFNFTADQYYSIQHLLMNIPQELMVTLDTTNLQQLPLITLVPPPQSHTYQLHHHIRQPHPLSHSHQLVSQT